MFENLQIKSKHNSSLSKNDAVFQRRDGFSRPTTRHRTASEGVLAPGRRSPGGRTTVHRTDRFIISVWNRQTTWRTKADRHNRQPMGGSYIKAPQRCPDTADFAQAALEDICCCRHDVHDYRTFALLNALQVALYRVQGHLSRLNPAGVRLRSD